MGQWVGTYQNSYYKIFFVKKSVYDDNDTMIFLCLSFSHVTYIITNVEMKVDLYLGKKLRSKYCIELFEPIQIRLLL